MTNTLSAGIGIITSISGAVITTIFILNLAELSFKKLDHAYREEYVAHQCGRALAAMTNIKIEASSFQPNRHNDARELTSAVKFLTDTIERSVTEEATIYNDRCSMKTSNGRGAKLHRYDRFHTRSNQANYTYKLIRGEPI